MRIAYRRMSGAMPLSVDEKGSRGIWWEKRWGLIRALRERGHKVDFVSRISKTSEGQWRSVPLQRHHDLMLLEFGSSNTQFYGNDLRSTVKMLAQHQGKVIFLCDDPDLPFTWAAGEGLDYSRWTCWYNATKRPVFPNQPACIPVLDFPFATLVRGSLYTPHQIPTAVYLGRPNGRTKALQKVREADVPLTVAGKAAEWTDFQGLNVVDPPEQPKRAAFYKQYRAALVLADAKHKAMGWRTGRAYHALAAGVPIFCEPDHPAMPSGSAYTDGEDLKQKLAMLEDEKLRRSMWAKQYLAAQEDKKLCTAAFEGAGL